jgi:hypothetical protein
MGEPLLAPVLRLLEEGREREALALLQTPQEGLPEAERLALLGFLEGRKGDLRAYRALALEAAQRAQTPLTLWAWPSPQRRGPWPWRRPSAASRETPRGRPGSTWP